ncbi:MAG: class I SAM-dependent methyltransferase [Gemmatimonadaceae bacterium]
MLTLDGVSAPETPGAAARVLGFVRPWAYGASRAAYLFAVGWTRWKNRAAIVEICRELGYDYSAREKSEVPTVSMTNLVPDASLLDVREIDAVDGNVTERELVSICRLVRSEAPASIFEIGTFDGRTTVNLAVNAPRDAHVHTLDLPRESIEDLGTPIHPHEVRYADKQRSGSRFVNTEVATRITQHYGDSATFNFDPFYNNMDFVFIDGSHAYEYVVNDSLHAVRMLQNGIGMVLWHDYSRWDGVTRAVNDLRRFDERFRGVRWIEGTTLACLKR